jgi:hypothetical protein
VVPEIIVALFCTLYIVIFLNLLIRFVETERKKGKVLLPTMEDTASRNRYRIRTLSFAQKNMKGLFFMLGIVLPLVVMMLIFHTGNVSSVFPFLYWALMPFIYLNLFDSFEICENGICGDKLYRWDVIKQVSFEPIDIFHRYYGLLETNETTYAMWLYDREGKKLMHRVTIVNGQERQDITELLEARSVEVTCLQKS